MMGLLESCFELSEVVSGLSAGMDWLCLTRAWSRVWWQRSHIIDSREYQDWRDSGRPKEAVNDPSWLGNSLTSRMGEVRVKLCP